MTTIDLTSAAQLYIALVWDGISLRKVNEDNLLFPTSTALADLYRPLITTYKPELLTVLAVAETLRDENPEAVKEAEAACAAAAEGWAFENRAFVDAVEAFRVKTQPEACCEGPCGQCDWRDDGVEEGCERGVVSYALALAALPRLRRYLVLPEPDTDAYEVRRRVLHALKIDPAEFGVARSFYLKPSKKHLFLNQRFFAPDLLGIDRFGVERVLKTRRGMTPEDALRLTNEAHSEARGILV